MNRNVLSAALARVAKVNPAALMTRKIRDELMLEITDSLLVLTAMGPLAKMRLRVPHGMLAPAKGARAVSLGLLSKLCGAYEASAELDLGFADTALRIRSGKRVQELVTEEPDTYVFQARTEPAMQARLSEILAALNVVKAACATGDVTNPTHRALRLQVSDKVATATAVDGYRALVKKFSCDAPDIDVLLPPQALPVLESLNTGDTPFAAVHISASWMSVATMDCDIDIRLIDGQHPNVMRLIGDPKARAGAACQVNRLDLLAALGSAVLVSEKQNRVELDLAGGVAKITAESNTGSFMTELPASGADVGTVGFNCQYGVDALKSFASEYVWIAGETSMIVMSDDFAAAQNLACMAGMRG